MRCTLTSRRIRRRCAGGLLLLGLGLLQACSQDEPLRVSINSWIGYESLALAEDFGWLPEKVRLIKVNSMADSVSGLHDGSVDAAAMTLDEMLLARARGLPLTAVSVFDVSAGADQLLARPSVQSLEEMRGRRIGLTESALSPLLLAAALESVNLKLRDVTTVRLTSSPVAAWSRGEVDAVVTYEPYASRLREGGARLLFDTRQMPDTVMDVLVMHRERVKFRQLRPLLKAQFRAVDYIHAYRQDAHHRIAARHDLEPQDVSSILGTLILPDARASRSFLQPAGKLEQAARRLSELMVAQGLLSRPDSLDHLQDAGAHPVVN